MNYHIETDDLIERLKWLVRLRWFGIIGVFVGTHILREVAFLSFSLIPVYLILGFAALYNVFYAHVLKTGIRDRDPEALAISQMLLDQVTLALTMYFSGGCDSPFIYFFIFHIVISGILLSWKYTLMFSALAVFFPAVVMGLKHIGVLPHYGIFRDEPMLFTNIPVVASYGLSFVATVFLTAYFVTYLSRRLYEKNEEVRRLYLLSERLRSSIRISEVIAIIERELSGYAGVGKSTYISLDKTRRVLVFRANDKEINIPLVDKNCFSDALLKGVAMTIDFKTVTSEYEKEVLILMNSQRLLVLPVMAASVSPCYDYFQCNDTTCEAYGGEAGRCWQMSVTHCRGKILRNYIEKLDACLSCELFTPVGLYALSVPAGFTPLDRIDVDACMRLLNAAGTNPKPSPWRRKSPN